VIELVLMIRVTWEREQPLSRYLDTFKDGYIISTKICKVLYIDNIESVTDSRGEPKEGPLSKIQLTY
jgi:hypothetical protein